MSAFYRSVWVSDVHLCSRDSQAEVFHNFISNIKCDYLYLVGDIIDVWALRKKWYWPTIYNEVVHKLLKRSRRGAKVTFIPGNHDEFFRDFIGYRFGDVKIVADAIHVTADGRRFLVTHGDEFDAAVRCRPWLAHLGDWAYGYLVVVNRMLNAVRRRLDLPYWSLSGAIKRKVKRAVNYLNDFEMVLARARQRGVDGVICGHIHQPAQREIDGVLYCNTGDWIENCTALVEHADGRLEIVSWHPVLDDRCQPAAAKVTDAEFQPIEPLSEPGAVEEELALFR